MVRHGTAQHGVRADGRAPCHAYWDVHREQAAAWQARVAGRMYTMQVDLQCTCMYYCSTYSSTYSVLVCITALRTVVHTVYEAVPADCSAFPAATMAATQHPLHPWKVPHPPDGLTPHCQPTACCTTLCTSLCATCR